MSIFYKETSELPLSFFLLTLQGKQKQVTERETEIPAGSLWPQIAFQLLMKEAYRETPTLI
jgi:hypothetical protein